MIHRRLVPILVAVLTLGAASGLFAQAVGADQQQAQAPSRSLVLTEGRVFSFDIGMTGGVPFSGATVEVGRYLAFDVNVANTLAAGIADITSAGTTYLTFRVSYFILPSVGATIYLGSDGNPAGGIGLFYDVLKSRPDAGLATALKIRLDCLVDSTGFNNGRLILGIVSSIGL